MKCPFCAHPDTHVIDSRTRGDGQFVRRRRECLACGKRFTTKEYADVGPILVIKADGRREPFDRNKILHGVQLACTKRPISVQAMEDLVAGVEAELRELGAEEVESKLIGEKVAQRLKELDDVAYVRFASVYRKFQTKEGFLEELRQLKGE
ncbi:MAG: transcriptional regulator NrdR [candidate division KSB1 bacterium]|nr:transcriptional regulator NrdR [candidate division KSB1 bacterium]MDZ7384520.1 transcriptional regulator NrdR [candidate division KSB1 bacterium]MDZ7392817.1 transcriptional regulator NrdR [candidate division KSB1 bacterium]